MDRDPVAKFPTGETIANGRSLVKNTPLFFFHVILFSTTILELLCSDKQQK